MKLRTQLSIAILSIALMDITPVMAQTQTITEQQAVNAVPTISLKVNQGMNLKLPSGVRVYKGWLDDGTLAQVDGDRPFEQGASIIHLVARKPGQTQLSLMARDSSGVDSLYVFKLVAGSKGASIVNIQGRSMAGGTLLSPIQRTPQHSTTFVSQVQSAAYTPVQQDGVEIFKRGIDFAISRGLIIPNSAFHKKLNAFVRRIGNGMSPEQAAGRSKLSGRTIEQIFNMGRSVPRPLIPSRDQTLVKAPVTTPVVEVKPPSVVPPNNSETVALEQRIAELERKVLKLDNKVASLDGQQAEFLARLEQLDVQQDVFLAKVEQLSLPTSSPKRRPPITLALDLPEPTPIFTPEPVKPSVKRAAKTLTTRLPQPPIAAKTPFIRTSEVKPLAVPSVIPPMGGENTLNNHQVANAISMGLLKHPDTPYGNWLHRRYQSMIRRLRGGADPISAAKQSNIKLVHVSSVLRQGGVDPAEAGL